ncbi:YicC family protein [Bacillus infantis]|uniref:YicC/YloC family endoribonuclease n=1 Tax=Bacillus infantis TaxID=324767 RepID=UPI001CD4DDEC|nr:YicC/YloC family endoribonuclease [Bacillus infantis]MCA1040710.1 YicC family protein [Bacillus infantis]
MVSSMTGYGRSNKSTDGLSVTIELKTVNHRFSEHQLRIPRQMIRLEDKIKKVLASRIKRGRVELFAGIEGEGAVSRKVNVDWDLLDEYYQYIMQIKERYHLSDGPSITDLASREDMLSIQEEDAADGKLEAMVIEAVEEAAERLTSMRKAEGAELEKDIRIQLDKLQACLAQLKNLAPLVIKQYGDRLEKKMTEFLGEQIDQNRILAEVAVFSDKADINEEITRLESHIGQFGSTLLLDEPVGRKLDFLLQEMNREANTIGSKANDSSIAREVVEIKSLLEKMKEQVQNIE